MSRRDRHQHRRLRARSRSRRATRRPAATPPSRARRRRSPLRFRGTRSRHLTRPAGAARACAGTVAGAGAGTPVFLIGRALRPARATASRRAALTAPTAPTGCASPRGPSRRLRVGLPRPPTDPLLACSRPLELRTPARRDAARRPRAVRRRPRAALRPAARRHVPARGKTVELQAFERGRWRTFETARARRGGRFSARLPLLERAPPGARSGCAPASGPDALYPFSTGHSRVVRVRVV